MSKMPFFLRWCCNNDQDCGNSDGSPNGYLPKGTPDSVTPTHITISNKLEDETITINPVEGATEASSDNYHYQLTFNTGVLVDPASVTVDGENWSISFDEDSNDNFYLLWIGETKTLNTPDETLEVTLNGLAAESGTTTEVTVSWNLDNLVIEPITRPGPPPDYETNITLELEMVNTTGQTNSLLPLYVGFVGDNKVYNTGDEARNLQLRVTNTSLTDDGNSDVTFHYSSDPDEGSQLIVTLEVEDINEEDPINVPWALGRRDQVGGISISIDGWEQQGQEPDSLEVGEEVRALQWTFTPEDNVFLHPQETLLINLDGIKTAHPTGETNLYLDYKNVSDGQSGQFICQIEKAPLVFDDKVRIGTSRDFDGKLIINDSITFDSTILEVNAAPPFPPFPNYTDGNPCEIQNTGTLIFRSDVGGDYSSSSVQFFKKDESTPLMELKADGSLGIGTSEPAAKLHVSDGDAKIDGQLEVNTIAPPDIPDIGNRLSVEGDVAIINPEEDSSSKLDIKGDVNIDDGSLNFNNVTGLKINLWGTGKHQIGVQSNATYFRTGNYFGWYKGGSHSDGVLAPGDGGEVLMALKNGKLGIGTDNPSAKLDVQGEIRGKLWYSEEFKVQINSNDNSRTKSTKMLHSNHCFAVVTGVSGEFNGGGERIWVEIGDDEYWYLHAAAGGTCEVIGKARCIGMP